MLDLHVRKVRETPYKLVMSGWNVIGIFERKDNKDVYIEKKNFTEPHKKVADMIHAGTLIERLEKAST